MSIFYKRITTSILYWVWFWKFISYLRNMMSISWVLTDTQLDVIHWHAYILSLGMIQMLINAKEFLKILFFFFFATICWVLYTCTLQFIRSDWLAAQIGLPPTDEQLKKITAKLVKLSSNSMVGVREWVELAFSKT